MCRETTNSVARELVLELKDTALLSGRAFWRENEARSLISSLLLSCFRQVNSVLTVSVDSSLHRHGLAGTHKADVECPVSSYPLWRPIQ